VNAVDGTVDTYPHVLPLMHASNPPQSACVLHGVHGGFSNVVQKPYDPPPPGGGDGGAGGTHCPPTHVPVSPFAQLHCASESQAMRS
jgi:hypothetical protein